MVTRGTVPQARPSAQALAAPQTRARPWRDRRAQRSPALLARLCEVMQGYRGMAHIIRARDLGVVLRLQHDSDPARTIRELVNEAIESGVPIGSVNLEAGGDGYFLVENEIELARCVRSLQSRAREILRKADRLVQAYRHGPPQPSLLPHE